MVLIEEKLHENPVLADVTLHVRRHLRDRLRNGAVPDDLAFLFGVSAAVAEKAGLREALKSRAPIQNAADRLAAMTSPAAAIVPLGHRDDFLKRCRQWLIERKESHPALALAVATDLETLLTISLAIDLARRTVPASPTASGPLPILIRGETGTGKELLARAIHEMSGRKGAFVVAHVSGLPEDLMVDELFGHVRGAFTGADRDRDGRLQEARDGTLLIDEIGDLPAAAQVRLLRFLQDGMVSRVGENTSRKSEALVIAATWHNLEKDIKRGKFRLDLYHRLSGAVLHLPPLARRDVRDVVPEILRQLGHQVTPAISRRALDALVAHAWTGNLRELMTVLRYAVSNAQGATVRLEDLPSHLQRAYLRLPLAQRAPGILCEGLDDDLREAEVVAAKVAEIDRQIEGDLQEPALPPALVAIKDFFEKFPDPTPDHEADRQAVGRLFSEVRRLGLLEQRIEIWKTIAAQGLPVDVAGVVAAKEDEIRVAMDSAQAAATAASVQSQQRLKASPWMRFVRDVTEIPLFAQVEPSMVYKAIATVAGSLFKIAPDWMTKVRGIIDERGLRGLAAEGLKAIESSNVVEVTEGVRRDYKNWTKEEWAQHIKECKSKTEAADAIGIGVKTLKIYLKKHGLA